MKLHVLSSSSKGNCYLLIGKHETLMLECGVNISKIKQALNFDFSKLVGCLITHEHSDHSFAAKELVYNGIVLYASKGTLEKIGISSSSYPLQHSLTYTIGSFRIMPFNVIHDAAEPFGFLISHQECGTFVFITDTHFVPFTFKHLNNVLIECNYSLDIANRNISNGANASVRNRVLKTHMEINTVKDFIISNDLSQLNNFVMLHLSANNSDANYFKSEISSLLPGKNVSVATNNLIIDFNKTPF